MDGERANPPRTVTRPHPPEAEAMKGIGCGGYQAVSGKNAYREQSMTHQTTRRIMLITLTLATLGCVTARTADAPIASLQEAQSMDTIVLSRGTPARIPAKSLTIELVSVKDDRCPEGVTCIWAGHATVALAVSKPGIATRTITVGTSAPAHMGLPYDAVHEGYRFHLAKLEPGNTQSPTTRYRATVQVSTESLENSPEAQPLDR